jgi:hypothetical protein
MGLVPSRAFKACAAPLLAVLALASCVPEGPPTASGGAAPAPARTSPPAVPSRPAPAEATGPLINAPFEDTFERKELGDDWNALGPAWHIENGRLCGRGARNRGVWLRRRLPPNARVEFDAYAESATGDIKVEVWGDGHSGATSTSYTNATSYIAILGGWKNSKHILARINEHGDDRLELDVDPQSDDERARPVSPGQPYHFRFERTDDKTVVWSVNGQVYFDWADDEPLIGPGHDHVGFNDWEAPVCFDNLKVTPL